MADPGYSDGYSDPDLAALYDALNPWGPSDDFYLSLVMSAAAVLDVGCGTGTLLHRARQAGHTGRLAGLDPAAAMIDQARSKRSDVEWVHGEAASAAWKREFDLAVMTGHAFQELVTDDELRASLAAVRAALTEGGRFAFETRNPLMRTWERWTPDNVIEVVDASGVAVRVWYEVEAPVDGVVWITETTTSPDWDRPKVSRGRMRFLGADELSTFLSEAGLVVEEQFGDWDRCALTDTSPEIITIARRG